jgi:hypothetical protein
MVKIIVILILSFLTTSCGQLLNQDPRRFTSLDPTFKPQLEVFESLYGRPVYDIAIGFADLQEPKVGLCIQWSSGHWEIHIDKKYWARATPEARLGLVLHELGHCVLKRDHVSKRKYYEGQHVLGEIPVSLMYPYNFYSYSFSELESYYLKELFNPSSSGKFEDNVTQKTYECDEH